MRRSPYASMQRHCGNNGFTLIELLVVVAIIAITSGLLVPIFLQARDKARKLSEQQATSAVLHPQPVPDSIVLPSGSLPILDAVVIKMRLTSSYHRIGMDVFTRYRVDCTGRVVFRPANGTKDDHVLLLIPFPDNALEVRDVQMKVHRQGSEELFPADEVIYTKKGIYGVFKMGPQQILTADVSFTALGREQLDYALPPSRQIRSVAITLDLPLGQARVIPDDSLQPIAAAQEQIRWEFKNLVSDRKITVLIPGAEAPLARVLLLSRLVALAVLLFGAGFWYLSEQAQPGQLDGFRLGHFLLLALTFSLFFVIFAVLEFHGRLGTPLAMLVSAIFSLPLLILHVARILSLRFAVTRVVPLAIFALGLVVNGVYGASMRDYVFIAAAIGIIGFLTVSYQGWAAGREQYDQEQELGYRERRRALVERISSILGGQIMQITGADAQAAEYVSAEERTALIEARGRLVKSREPVSGLMKEYDELVKGLPYINDETRSRAVLLCKDLERRANLFQERLDLALTNLQAELTAYRAALLSLAEPPGRGEVYCSACGKAVPDAPFCQQCGATRPLRVTCAGCGDHIVIPVHLVMSDGEDKPAQALFCPHCGTRIPV